jgi:hypothetical protein
MEVEQIMSRLLAKIRINQEEMRAGQQHLKGVLRTNQAQTDANLRKMRWPGAQMETNQERMEANQEKKDAKIDANQERLKSG